jgi:hypothetical protein
MEGLEERNNEKIIEILKWVVLKSVGVSHFGGLPCLEDDKSLAMARKFSDLFTDSF